FPRSAAALHLHGGRSEQPGADHRARHARGGDRIRRRRPPARPVLRRAQHRNGFQGQHLHDRDLGGKTPAEIRLQGHRQRDGCESGRALAETVIAPSQAHKLNPSSRVSPLSRLRRTDAANGFPISCHPGRIPALPATPPHFAMSSRMRWVTVSGAPASAVIPCAMSASVPSAELRMSFTAWLSRATIVVGVGAGATTATHKAASYPAMPASATVGTSGSTATRVLPLVASARNCPAWILGSDGAMVANCMSRRPVIMSVTDCAELL